LTLNFKLKNLLHHERKQAKMKIIKLFLCLAVLSFSPVNLIAQVNDYLIWDPDQSHNSGPVLDWFLIDAGYNGDYTTDITPYLGSLANYKAIFICLGRSPNNYILTNGEIVDSLVSYLVNHDSTNLYVEGRETWYEDLPTILHPYFHIQGDWWRFNSNFLYGFLAATCFEDVVYEGFPMSMRHIIPLDSAFVILWGDDIDVYVPCGIAYDDQRPSYRTIGTSFLYGEIFNDSLRISLADTIMCCFFGICPSVGIHECFEERHFNVFPILHQNQPNPFSKLTAISYQIPNSHPASRILPASPASPSGGHHVSLNIYDITGRLIETLVDEKQNAGVYEVNWDGSNQASGVYFSKLRSGDFQSVRKVILLR
jgi:hypothetical protein